MRKLLAICMAVIMCTTFSGCVSDADYEELEKRVSYLEDQLGTKYEESETENTTTEKEGQSSDNEEQNIQTENSSEEENSLSNEQSSYTYIISELSDDAVIQECESIFNNVPSEGQTFESYIDSFNAAAYSDDSWNNFSGGYFYLYFYNQEAYSETNEDVIKEVYVEGIQTEMDGTIGHASSYYLITVKMSVHDYERATSIYDKLYNLPMLQSNLRNVSDNRQSTVWKANGTFTTSPNSTYGFDFISMSKMNDSYDLSATYAGYY